MVDNGPIVAFRGRCVVSKRPNDLVVIAHCLVTLVVAHGRRFERSSAAAPDGLPEEVDPTAAGEGVAHWARRTTATCRAAILVEKRHGGLVLRHPFQPGGVHSQHFGAEVVGRVVVGRGSLLARVLREDMPLCGSDDRVHVQYRRHGANGVEVEPWMFWTRSWTAVGGSSGRNCNEKGWSQSAVIGPNHRIFEVAILPQGVERRQFGDSTLKKKCAPSNTKDISVFWHDGGALDDDELAQPTRRRKSVSCWQKIIQRIP